MNQLGGNAVMSFGPGLFVADCTIAYNTLPTTGSGLVVPSLPFPSGELSRVVNCVLWNNARGGIRDQAAQIRVTPGTFALASCCIGGWTGTIAGAAVHGLDPLFRDPVGPDGAIGTDDDDFRLVAGSPCVDAGNTTAVPSQLVLHLDARPRIADDPATPDTGTGGPPVVDMGAYER